MYLFLTETTLKCNDVQTGNLEITERGDYICIYFLYISLYIYICTHHGHCKNCRKPLFMSLASMSSIFDVDGQANFFQLRSPYTYICKCTILEKALDISCAHICRQKKKKV